WSRLGAVRGADLARMIVEHRIRQLVLAAPCPVARRVQVARAVDAEPDHVPVTIPIGQCPHGAGVGVTLREGAVGVGPLEYHDFAAQLREVDLGAVLILQAEARGRLPYPRAGM